MVARVRQCGCEARLRFHQPPLAETLRSSETGDLGAVEHDAELGVRVACPAAVVQRDAEGDGEPRVQLLVVRAGPCERGAQLGIEREDARPDGIGVTDPAAGLTENGDVDGVRRADRVLLPRRGQLLGSEVAHGLRDRVAHAELSLVHPLDERGVDQAAERVDRVDRTVAAVDSGDDFDGIERCGT
jgi:hypothetical protein